MVSRTLNSHAVPITAAGHLQKRSPAFALSRIRFPFCPAHRVLPILAALLCLVVAGAPPARAQSATLTTLYSFSAENAYGSNVDGANPIAALIQASDGNLYGTASLGGAYGYGTAFQITPAGAFTTLHSFATRISPINGQITDEAYPYAALIQASDGNFYGTTAAYPQGFGTVFQITPTGILTTLHVFVSNSMDGEIPVAALIQASDGNLYGTTSQGGTNGEGTIFRITPAGAFTTLYSFSALNTANSPFTNTDGADPRAGLIQASDGNLYGTTSHGGANGYGTIFQITPAGAFTTLYSFSAEDGTGHNADGAVPVAALIQASDGNLYGTASEGGANGIGTVFRITLAGAFTTLYSFNFPDGYYPVAALIQASDGNFYGTSSSGGAYDWGAVYRITPAGMYTTIYSFNYIPEGYSPMAALIQASDGNFYGTTSHGGPNDYGTIFCLSVVNTPSPSLSSLSPSSAIAGGPAFTLTINGSNFLSGAVANWNGTPLTTTFVSATKLTAAVPAADIAGAGSANVTVTNPGGSLSNGLSFTITAPAPVLSSINPSSVNAGHPNLTLTLKGNNFLNTSGVNWTAGGVTTALATTYVSATKLTAIVPASLMANPGAAGITVVTPGAGTSNFKTLTINLTTIKLTHATFSRDPTNQSYVIANLTLSNTGFRDASNVTINESWIIDVYYQTLTRLPINLGTIPAGGSVNVSLTYSTGSGGLKTHLYVFGYFTGSVSYPVYSYSSSLTVTLP